MERISVKSSNIKSVGFEGGTLQVEYKNGGIYEYQNVTAKQVAELHASESIGKYLHSTIRPNHECRKIGTAKEEAANGER